MLVLEYIHLVTSQHLQTSKSFTTEYRGEPKGLNDQVEPMFASNKEHRSFCRQEPLTERRVMVESPFVVSDGTLTTEE